jgi:hypothetical protein
MRILGLIVGFLLAAFGGGCTLLFFGVSVAEGSANAQLWQTWVMFGLLPLIAGVFIMYGMRRKP